MTRPLVIYHDHCNDGFTAAWVAHQALPDAEFHSADYRQAPPGVKERDILILDFSYPRAVLEELAGRNRSVAVLDHHKTAAMDLAFLPLPPSFAEWQEIRNIGGTYAPLAAHFDMARSGAGLAWDFFYPATPRPPLVDFVEDRDLWRFGNPHTRAIHAMLSSHEYEFGLWTGLNDAMKTMAGMNDLINEGETIMRSNLRLLYDMLAATKRRGLVAGHDVPVANVPYAFASDAGNILCEGEPFAATYVCHGGGTTVSLRSTSKGLDVSEIAKQHGGGGHRNAAGFTLPPGVPFPIPA